jgi:hypothetical protein
LIQNKNKHPSQFGIHMNNGSNKVFFFLDSLVDVVVERVYFVVYCEFKTKYIILNWFCRQQALAPIYNLNGTAWFNYNYIKISRTNINDENMKNPAHEIKIEILCR